MALDQYTVSLLHFNDGIRDEMGKVWTATNGASVSAVQSKFGGASLYLDGSQYISTGVSDDFNFGTGDFTIDWWQYVTDVADTAVSFQTAGGYELLLNYISSRDLVLYASSTGNTVWDIASSVKMGTVHSNQWAHYAVCRQGNTIYLFENGILQNKANVNNKSFAPVTNVHIGRYGGPRFKGYIDEFRISKGIARWTDNFTPLTEPYDGGTPSVSVPTNLAATTGDAKVTLNWNAVIGATGYNVKRSQTAGGSYATIGSNVSGTSYVDTSVVNGTTYYYVVTAITADGESANSNEASATPMATSGGNPGTGDQALLRITMVDSSEREYKLPETDINGFVNWFTRTVGTGISCYALNNIIDGSKEYLAYEKIISFKVVPVA